MELVPTPKFTKHGGTPFFVAKSKDKFGKPIKKGGLPLAVKLGNLEELPEHAHKLLNNLDGDNKPLLVEVLSHLPGTDVSSSVLLYQPSLCLQSNR